VAGVNSDEICSEPIFCFTRRSRRRKEQGFHYVYINDDGSARELDNDEKEYLNAKFHGADGARPYIKFRYESLTPDGRIGGYLERRQLPFSNRNLANFDGAQ
jgi:hypothetical protein